MRDWLGRGGVESRAGNGRPGGTHSPSLVILCVSRWPHEEWFVGFFSSVYLKERNLLISIDIWLVDSVIFWSPAKGFRYTHGRLFFSFFSILGFYKIELNRVPCARH